MRKYLHGCAGRISILPPPEAADFDAMMRRGENEVRPAIAANIEGGWGMIFSMG